MKGTGLNPPEIKDFLEASYQEKAPKSIRGYVLDEELSNLYGKVYVNEDIQKVIISFRGTGIENLGIDWINNLVFFSELISIQTHMQAKRAHTAPFNATLLGVVLQVLITRHLLRN